MNASIIISTNSNRTLFENFLTNLSEYPTIQGYEIIVVNDGGDYILSTSQCHALNLSNVCIINLSEKRGYGAANNLAIEKASCDYLIFMNDDIILKPNCLEIMLDALQKDEVSAVQPKLIYPQNNLIQSTGHIFTKFTNAHALENSNANSSLANQSHERQALTTALCATKKEIFIKNGLFSTEYYNAWEGMEYTLKLSLNGGKCWYEHKAEAYHIRGGARSQYPLNEEAQSAVFWSKWSDKINEDLHQMILPQLSSFVEQDYLVLNFSKLPNPDSVLIASGIRISEVVCYTYISGAKTLDFFRCLPNAFCRSNSSIIYFSNNFTQTKNNLLWFKCRKNKNDLIIDLSGNVIPVSSLLKDAN